VSSASSKLSLSYCKVANLTKGSATVPNLVTFFDTRILADILHHPVHILFNILQCQLSDGVPLDKHEQ
jgi:hypothetical protein